MAILYVALFSMLVAVVLAAQRAWAHSSRGLAATGLVGFHARRLRGTPTWLFLVYWTLATAFIAFHVIRLHAK
jgi:ABC-type arginine transport system permease subunit